MHPPTASQWTAVGETSHHLLVAAGAGTGKTHTVVWKVLYLLGAEVHGQRIAEPLRLRDIAAITYTNQAAKDLKEALRRGLRAVGRRDDAFEVDLARIGTIHSFCSDLLKEHALRAGRPPFREVLEEGVGRELALEAARDTLVEALDRPDRGIDGLDTLLAAHKSTDVDRWVTDLMRRADLVRRLHADATVVGWERVLLELATRALDRYEAALLRDGALDFDRMVIWTRDLLRDDAAIRAALRRRIKVLIVDEFQDVDPVQKEIAYLLGDPSSGATDTTRLVLVGDPKQSIYRFRHADVSVWSAVERDFTQHGQGRVVPLADNFRSVPAVLSFVEACVGPVLNTPIAGDALQPFEVPFRAVQPTREAVSDGPAVEFIVVPPDPSTQKPLTLAPVREAEAEAIARRLRALHDAGTPWQDMALLIAGWAGLDVYRSALERHGIPAYALRGEGFYETREVLDLVLALQAIRDPREDRALLGFLRSPFVGLRDESLAAMALAHRTPYFDRLGDVELTDAEEQARLVRAHRWLEDWGRLRDREPVTALLHRVLDETGYVAHLALLGEGKQQAIANVRQFLSIVRAMGDVGVDDLLRAIEERRAREDRTPEARLHAESDPVVTITSIHVAKGLEWPVVVWADASAGDRNFNDKLVVLSDAIALGRPNLKPDEQEPQWQALRTRYLIEEDAEAKRLWYVAATRARDRLIVSGIAQPKPRTAAPIAGMLLARFPSLATATHGDVVAYTGEDGIVREASVIAARHAELPVALVPEMEYARVKVGDPAALELPPAPVRVGMGPGRHSATSLLAHSRCGKRYWLKYVAGLREPKPFGSRETLISAVARGQIVHDVIERYDDESSELDVLLEDAIGRWDEHAPPPDTAPGRRYRGELRGEVERVVEHPEWSDRVARDGTRRELSFLHLAGPDAITQGAIDLAALAEDGEALELIDVKTTQCSAPEAARRAEVYRPQREVYVAAASAISQLPVLRFGFLYSRPGVNVEEELDDAERDAARANVLERIAHAASGEAEMTTDPAECRACGFRRVRLCAGVE
jgi:ATP-dependent helicase/nuclease subunit A